MSLRNAAVRRALTAAACLAALVLALAGAALAASSLTTVIQASISGTYFGSTTLGTSQHTTPAAAPINLGNGTGQNQANVLYEATRTLGASANETLDLFGGLTDPFGNTINLTAVKAIEIFLHADATNSLIIGNAASNAFVGPLGGTTPTITLPPGGKMLLIAPVNGWAVANGSTDNLKFANSGSGTSVTYDIKIIGTQ